MIKIAKILLSLFLILCTCAYAETITEKRNKSIIQLTPLKKLTVGPDDQYHAAIDPTGAYIVFTRKSDLAPHLCIQNIQTGETSNFLSPSADSEEPVFNSDGTVAFTYFKFHSRGDICYKKLSQSSDDKLTCLEIGEGEPSTPFWKSPYELGYLLKENWSQNSKIVVENLKSGTKQILAEGRIWSPSMKVGGRYLFYNQMIRENDDRLTRVLIMKDLENGATKRIRFSLPGISGFPSVSEDEKYLYFSHYLNDTNHDNVIDGNDNSVLFRAPINDLIHQDETFPEQLTSVDSNCSFPRLHQGHIYATCAFEGALDIYQLPETGIVPISWTETILNNAHLTSRSYSDRILLLNTIKYRLSKINLTSIDERILSNHIMSDDLASAKYYLQHLSSSQDKSIHNFYKLLDYYLDAKQIKNIQKTNEITPSLEKEISTIDNLIDSINDHSRFKLILKGLLQKFLNKPKKSSEFLSRVSFSNSPKLDQTLAIERYFYFELARWTFTKTKAFDDLLRVYHQMMKAEEFQEDSQIYYAFEFLHELQTKKMSPQERIAVVQKMNHDLTQPVSNLLKSEILALKISSSTDKKAKDLYYQELDRLMSQTRNDYVLRKAASIRTILNFADSGEFTYLGYIASNWIRFTETTDSEFSYSRENFAIINLDRAYESLGKKDYLLARGFFFGSLTLTDDLESHDGYIRSMITKGERSNMNRVYKNLKEHEQIGDNMKFVDALLLLLDANPQSDNLDYLDKAINKLQTMEQDRDSAMRYLLLGYCFLEKLLRSRFGYEFEQNLFEQAHRNLMLAYNQGLDNFRIKASALVNLGLLHQQVRNHGLAVQFFSKRKSLGFLSPEALAQFEWLYARSLFYNYQSNEAAKELEYALEQLDTLPQASISSEIHSLRFAILERKGFYLMSAGKFLEATEAYEQFLKSYGGKQNPTSSNFILENNSPDQSNFKKNMILSKIYLSYGYCLYKIQQNKKAQKALEKALEIINQTPKINRDRNRSIAFNPNRMKLIVYGLMAQTEPTREGKLQALMQRLVLLKSSKELLDEWIPTLIRTELQLGSHLSFTHPEKAKVHFQNALQKAAELVQMNLPLSHAIYRSEVAYLIHAIQNPELYQNESSDKIQNLIENTVREYSKQKAPQPVLLMQMLKLQLLLATYLERIHLRDTHQQIQRVLDSQAYSELKESSPLYWKELQTLKNALTFR